ncbi:MAG: SDR family NAD(P)-dependent oxidoreductase, partial [Mycobacterium sp.]|nr:SDR family NAD(P)-dependent oxidoreductase [Mycobacterium sp.]
MPASPPPPFSPVLPATDPYRRQNRRVHGKCPTGGSKGMGLAIAECLAAEGASVAIMARGAAALESAAARVAGAGAPEVIPVSVDMSD